MRRKEGRAESRILARARLGQQFEEDDDDNRDDRSTSTSAPTSDAASLVARAERLVPLLCEHARAIEDGRWLTPAVQAALVETGMYRITMPPPFIDRETCLPEAMRVLEVLATGDASTAWSVCLRSECRRRQRSSATLAPRSSSGLRMPPS